jgi:hypothetical protein
MRRGKTERSVWQSAAVNGALPNFFLVENLALEGQTHESE